MILSGPRVFLVDWAISVLYICSLIMLKCAIPEGIFGSLKLLFRGGGKTVFHTKISLFFMDMAIFPKESFNAGSVLNC